MRLRPGIAGLVLLAALAARAGETAAPLQDSRKELKALGKDQPAVGGEGAVEKLRGTMPQMQMPAAEARPLDPLAAEKAEKELKKKKAAEKNWLVNGMERLDRNDKSAGRGSDDGLAETPKENGPPDAGDPEYLLKVYSDQQKGADAKGDGKRTTAIHHDPLKPFLQGWLADSPARGKFFDDYARKPDAGPGYAGPTAPAAQNPNPGPTGFDSGGTNLKNERTGVLPAQPNPYLQGVDLTFLQDGGPPHAPAPSVPAFQPAPPSPAASAFGPAPAARETTKKSLPSTREDDKKYFPQLKRF